jgi:uncharacterized protein DUF4383
MSHIPVNHPLRGFYRFLATLTGLYVLAFGVIGFAETTGTPTFSQDHLHWVLGLRTNLAFAELSVVAGAIIVVAAVIGRNIDRFVNVGGGLLFMAAGMAMLILLRTDANFLGFSMANCVVSFLIGTVLFSAGLYGKVGSVEAAAAEERARHGHGHGGHAPASVPATHTVAPVAPAARTPVDSVLDAG